MLNGTLVCHDARCERKARCHPGCIRDVEAFAARVIRNSEFVYTPDFGKDDLLVELIVAIWELEAEHDPSRGSLTTFAFSAARNKIADADRRRYRTRWVFRDRVYERPRPNVVSLDSELGDAHTARAVDATPDRSPDLMRVLGAGRGPVAGRVDPMGEAPSRRAA